MNFMKWMRRRPTYRQKLLADNIVARVDEVATYDVNIANYEYVLAMPHEPDLGTFRRDIQARLAAERIERRKAEIILEALRAQAG